MKSLWTAALAAGLGAAVTFSVAMPASAAEPTVKIGTVTRIASGGAASVSLAFVCDAGRGYQFQVAVFQGAEGRQIGGFASGAGICTGKSQMRTTGVIPSEPYRAGAAAVVASVSSLCDRTGTIFCTGDAVQEVHFPSDV